MTFVKDRTTITRRARLTAPAVESELFCPARHVRPASQDAVGFDWKRRMEHRGRIISVREALRWNVWVRTCFRPSSISSYIRARNLDHSLHTLVWIILNNSRFSFPTEPQTFVSILSAFYTRSSLPLIHPPKHQHQQNATH